jgi:hypothetical protein
MGEPPKSRAWSVWCVGFHYRPCRAFGRPQFTDALVEVEVGAVRASEETGVGEARFEPSGCVTPVPVTMPLTKNASGR